MYVSGQLNTAARMELLVRSESDLAEVVTDIRDLIREFDPALLVDLEIRPVDALARAALVRPRFYTLFFSGLALLALFLAALGVYGTTAFVTRARTQEMGIRLVLGASRRHVIWQGASRTMGAIAAGVAFGVCVAAVGSQALDRFLVTVPPHDAFTYCAMGLLVLAAGGVAAVVPAARAGRADPAQTLRESR
jgi:ABC-type antimicrobial peptide transport system permease subunit